MKLEHIAEPRLRFASGEHICPRKGISTYGAFDRTMGTRRSDVIVGGVGTSTCIEGLERWIARCGGEIAAAEGAKQPNLRVPFPGFGLGHGFDAKLVFGQDLARALKKSDVDELIAISDRHTRLTKAIDLYYEHIKFLAQNRPVDVVVCVIPEPLYKVISTDEPSPLEESLEASV